MATKAICVLLLSFSVFAFSEFSVQYRVIGGAAYPMAQVVGIPSLWAAAWDAPLAEGEQTLKVRASTGTGANSVTRSVKQQEQPRVHASEMIAGKYQITKNHGVRGTTFVPAHDFKQGKPVVFRVKVADANSGLPVANATAEIFISGGQSTLVVSGPSNIEGIAEAKWKASASNKRKWKIFKGSETQTGPYKGTLTNISALGYLWDGESRFVNFTVLPK